MLYKKYKSLFNTYHVTTALRIAHFMAQIEHESNLKPISENLNYSKEGLLKVFPKYFNKDNVDQFARKPEKIANRVYANRMGNRSEASGDGWKFRGRGFIQLTGFNNYKALSVTTNVDYVNNPELLLTEADALIAALWFWSSNGLNTLADLDDVLLITKRINGGLNGIEDRKKKLIKWKNELNIK
ncbi:glycoside hydrolase family 19 protein [Myroides odoratus]|uniref:Predicted chitinase n=2 Tax=Myroides odoratus TaxID=256 RepID=A0A378RNQ1_MYROD|nr:glycoside hydrolase family 19 protein [Myroides odoratus]QQU04767.1 glycoside hydrolase family 19 protein [Myroides odoratus]STZ27787.1 Predicted chitinase [Myroides odoratus]